MVMKGDKTERDYGFPTACLSMTSYCVLWSGWFNSIILQQTNHSTKVHWKPSKRSTMPNENSSPDFKNSPHWIVVIGLQFQVPTSWSNRNEFKLSEVYEHEKSNKTKWEVGISHPTKSLGFTYIYWPVVKVFVLSRILIQLMLQIATSNR